eukprot:SAG11_NODE_1813_length_4218_cov_6.359553_1_plen_268_part_00
MTAVPPPGGCSTRSRSRSREARSRRSGSFHRKAERPPGECQESDGGRTAGRRLVQRPAVEERERDLHRRRSEAGAIRAPFGRSAAASYKGVREAAVYHREGARGRGRPRLALGSIILWGLRGLSGGGGDAARPGETARHEGGRADLAEADAGVGADDAEVRHLRGVAEGRAVRGGAKHATVYIVIRGCCCFGSRFRIGPCDIDPAGKGLPIQKAARGAPPCWSPRPRGAGRPAAPPPARPLPPPAPGRRRRPTCEPHSCEFCAFCAF